MPTEYELGEVALKQAVAQEQVRIQAFRNGRRRALYQPKPLMAKPGGNIYSNGRKVTLQELRERDESGIKETIQKITKGRLEPDAGGLWIVGGSLKDADWEAIQEVESDPSAKCDLCKSRFIESIPGEITIYGDRLYHFVCLMSKMLADCRGDPYEAAAKYNVPLTDVFNVRESYPQAIWAALRERSK